MKKFLIVLSLILCAGLVQPIMFGCPGCSTCTCDGENPPVKK